MKKVSHYGRIICCCLLALLSLESFADVRLPKLVGDHMILQRDAKLPVWGWADAGETVTLTFLGKKYTAKPDTQGKWMLTLPAMKAGGPYEMTIAGKNTLTIKDILVGDVWLASGQSNMEWKLSHTVNNFEQEIANANFPQIRFLDVTNAIATQPLTEFESKGWEICSPETAGDFSAVGYFFARDLHQRYKVPVGVITSEWGGTPSEAWTSTEALKAFPEYQTAVNDLEKNGSGIQAQMQEYQTKLKEWQSKVSGGDRGLAAATKWYAPAFNAADWPVMTLPMLWETTDLPDYDGIVWFRKEVMIPDNEAGKELTLHLASIDDADSTWFNGELVGATNGYNIDRKYTIPGKLVKAGKNSITIRVVDTGGGGGVYGQADNLKLTAGDKILVSLADKWQYQTALDISQMPAKPKVTVNQNSPTVLYNAMIAPLVPFAIKGAIWYQGESNAGRAYQYRTLFPAMIKDWRKQWKQDFPFLFVQLANFMKVESQPVESDWAELREAQSMTLSLPKTGMAVIIDVGDANDIHPRNKQDVGKRLAMAAQKTAYNENTVYSGPTYKSIKTVGNKIILTFENAGGGLVAKGGELKEFAIAGPDKKFMWADAKIEGNTVVVSSNQVQNPVAVRYAWANNPDKANLYNKEGLPASPFRTDDWPGITISRK
ncbi:sialate O-acetylesterase [Rhodocytophaga aerolata]|uniref:Sialate O-acetylesterase n=1 Tax=Rhodocytophaga aerolata TaxID=455078 RepID=A0ABT8RAP8_9BACT|nr:sialate O-acetylesterase [Rhodocytophaga aerolata]MDO1449152.1 sialate O-acetylesterase [Rhodocytophaga aerolata]